MRGGLAYFFLVCLVGIGSELRATDCKTKVLLLGALPSDGSLRIAQKVRVIGPGEQPFKAYFVGSDSAYLYFSKPGSTELITLDSRSVEFSVQPSAICLVAPRGRQLEGNSAAVSVLGCLRVLEDLEGLPPGRMNTLLQKFPWQLAENLNAELGENRLGETTQRVERFLTSARVQFVSTRSVPELLAHLEAGYPAYLALDTVVTSEPNLEDAESVLATKSSPQSASPSEGKTASEFLGVAAFGKLPAGRWFTGGEKVALIDSISGKVALWTAKALKRTPNREFILVFPYKPD